MSQRPHCKRESHLLTHGSIPLKTQRWQRLRPSKTTNSTALPNTSPNSNWFASQDLRISHNLSFSLFSLFSIGST